MHGYIRPLALISILGCAFAAACSPTSGEPAGGTGGSGGAGGSAGRGGSGGGTAGTGGGSAGSGGGSAGTGGSAGSGGSGGATPIPTPAKDGGTAGDKPGGADSGAATGGPLPPGMRKVYILHDANAGGSANDPSRKSILDVLASMKDSHGIVVELKNSPTKASEMMDGALIIVGPNSSMFGANHPDPGLKTVAIPIIVSKDGNTTEIGLGSFQNTQEFTTGLPVKIDIVNPNHPLAAGLSGVVGVLGTRCRLVRAGNLGPDAIKIANSPVDKNTWSIFAYEKGGMMPGGFAAPAKRMGFFWHRPSALTPDGVKLFKAAVDWALRP